jgi:sugar diacid utilization regulator
MTIGGCQTILIPIMVQNIEVARLVAIAACRPFSRFDRRLLRRTARYAYEVFIRDKSMIENSEVRFSSFLIQLLHGQTVSEDTIRTFYEKAGFKSENYSFYMMVIRSTANTDVSHDVFYIASHFKGLLTGKAYAIDGPNIVVLLNEPTSLRLVDSPLFDSLRERAKALGQVIGVSQRFSDILDVPKACANALVAANIGAEMSESQNLKRVPDRTVFFFWQTMPLALLRDVNSVTDVRKYVDPIVTDLVKYDKDHNTDYAYSLYCYLTYNCSMSDAAQIANIHKNTMVYRVRRIEEMFNISLTDPFHTFRLHLSFVILIYLGDLDERF